jgi:hypothetical protein
MVASYAVAGDAFRAGTPQPWSPTIAEGWGPGSAGYDLHPDGKRVAAAASQVQADAVQDKVVFVFNFAHYLLTIAPGNK